MAKETAEQKLLKILETSGQIPAGKSGSPKSTPVKMQFSVKTLNTLLIVAIVACVVMLGYEFQSGTSLMNKQVSFTPDQPPRRTVDAAELKPKDIAYYAQRVSERNIFKPFEKEVLDKNNVPVKPTLAKKLAKYKLVGVAWLDLPESASVMFEDTATGSTLFLREGEKLDDVTIKAIYTDRAVLSYENEEITIKL